SRHRGDDAACAAAVLGAVVVDQHLELAHRLDAQQAAGGAAGRAVALRIRVGAVDLITDLIRPGARNRYLRSHPAIDLLLRARRRGDAWLQERELAEIAAVQRQLADLLLLHERRHRRLSRVDDRGLGRDQHLLVGHESGNGSRRSLRRRAANEREDRDEHERGRDSVRGHGDRSPLELKVRPILRSETWPVKKKVIWCPDRAGGSFSMRTFVVAILVLAAASTGFAQITAATVSGTIKDTTGGVLPGVEVVVKNLDTGVSRSTTTDTNGAFTVPGLAPGRYEARATLPGFKVEAKSFDLAVAQEAGLNLTLEVGATEESITVAANAVVVDTRSSSLSALVPEKTIEELPPNGRNYNSLATLQPAI